MLCIKDCPAKADLYMLYFNGLCVYLMMHGVTYIAHGGFSVVSCVALVVLFSSEKGQVGVGAGLLQSLCRWSLRGNPRSRSRSNKLGPSLQKHRIES